MHGVKITYIVATALKFGHEIWLGAAEYISYAQTGF